jgi:Protein of unknown function (DUF3341)
MAAYSHGGWHGGWLMASGSGSQALPIGEKAGTKVEGVLAGFDTVDALLHASEKVRDAGYTNWDTHTPFPVHGLNEAMGIKPTRLQWVVLMSGATGLTTAVLLQWWMNVYDYPYIVSGKPFFSIPANVPIWFELTVLFSGLACFFGMLAFNKLPQFSHPVFSSTAFERATNDKFFISILADDRKFNLAKTSLFLQALSPSSFEELGG